MRATIMARPRLQRPLRRAHSVAHRPLLGLCAVAAALAVAGPAQAQESRTRLDVLGFTADAAHMLVRIEDNHLGLAMRLYEVKTGKPAQKSKLHEFERGDEFKLRRRLLARYKIVDPGRSDLQSADGRLAFFGVHRELQFVVAVTDFRRVGKWTEIWRAVDAPTKVLVSMRLRQIIWAADGRTMVLVV